jgi:hypothetical protein
MALATGGFNSVKHEFIHDKNRKIVVRSVEDLAAGADISARFLISFPRSVEILRIVYIGRGSAAGVDDANTAVLTAKVGSTAIAAWTFNTANTVPAVNVEKELTVVAAAAVLADASVLVLDVVQGATADLPAFEIQVEFSQVSTEVA